MATDLFRCLYPNLFKNRTCELPFMNIKPKSPRVFSPKTQSQIYDIVTQSGELQAYLAAIRRFCIAWKMCEGCAFLRKYSDIPSSCVGLLASGRGNGNGNGNGNGDENENETDTHTTPPNTTTSSDITTTTNTHDTTTSLYAPLLPHIVAIIPCSRLSDSQMAGPWGGQVSVLPPHLQQRPLHFGVEVFYTTAGDVQRHVISTGVALDVSDGRWRTELMEQVLLS